MMTSNKQAVKILDASIIWETDAQAVAKFNLMSIDKNWQNTAMTRFLLSYFMDFTCTLSARVLLESVMVEWARMIANTGELA